MFGAFRGSQVLQGGLLWKVPWRMSSPQKFRQRQRLKAVDDVVENLTLGLHVQRCQQKGLNYEAALEVKKKYKPRSEVMRLLNRSKYFPKEFQMSSKDKYTIFDKKSQGYRKGVHKVPKWTKLSLRKNPLFF
ncbi:54S ribosomal protein L31, mitochondrial [Nakaseomyces bracarensis]|uniref:Large ribosomal subunit protein mL60 n=1 Tax=Nakaseomyces bracarensis TaxID=273131 RepID=A0ABR4NMH1_9SACH